MINYLSGSLLVLRFGVLQDGLGLSAEVLGRNEVGAKGVEPLEPFSQESETFRAGDRYFFDALSRSCKKISFVDDAQAK